MTFNSWKEIAQYMGRGVRTMQRWEHDLGLPVHRPKGKDRSAVLAFAGELDAWLHKTPLRERSADERGQHSPGVRSNNGKSREVCGRTTSLTTALVELCRKQEEATNRFMELLNRTAGKATLRKR